LSRFIGGRRLALATTMNKVFFFSFTFIIIVRVVVHHVFVFTSRDDGLIVRIVVVVFRYGRFSRLATLSKWDWRVDNEKS